MNLVSFNLISVNPMSYPPAPWHLKGYAFNSFHLLDIEKVRPMIPSDLEIVSLLPGKTLGNVYVSAYTEGSILEYNELIISPALVRYQKMVGSWISHIYVDDPDSVAGGKEIWGLPKEMADFSWQKNQKLCQFNWKKGLLNLGTWWQQTITGKVLSGIDEKRLLFKSQFKSPIQLVQGIINIPSNSPFYCLQINQPFITLNFKKLNLLAEIPSLINY
ncbi:MAG: acetoacetate decarboxylase family protein [Crocosphaera sp.]